MKELNLLPSHIAFDYKKFIVFRLVIFFIILNVAMLFYISYVNIYINNKLKDKFEQRKSYLNNIMLVNKKFGKYKNQYIKLKKELVNLQSEIEYYKRIVVLHRSAYADSIIFINTFSNNTWFSSVSYENGFFKVNGYTQSKNIFQEFFRKLEANKYIQNIRFFYIKQKDSRYIFKINFRVMYR